PSTLSGSMAPVNGTRTRGWMLKPSSVFSSSMSKQSVGTENSAGGGGTTAGQVAGFGRLTRRPVFWVGSGTVNTSLGKGPPDGDDRSNRAWTPAAQASPGRIRTSARAGTSVRRSVIGDLPFTPQHRGG